MAKLMSVVMFILILSLFALSMLEPANPLNYFATMSHNFPYVRLGLGVIVLGISFKSGFNSMWTQRTVLVLGTTLIGLSMWSLLLAPSSSFFYSGIEALDFMLAIEAGIILCLVALQGVRSRAIVTPLHTYTPAPVPHTLVASHQSMLFSQRINRMVQFIFPSKPKSIKTLSNLSTTAS